MLDAGHRTAVLTPFAAPSNTTQAKTALFRGFLAVSVEAMIWRAISVLLVGQRIS